jgi:formate dehydrogenase subunit gamma
MDGKRMSEASAWNAERAKAIIAEHAGLEGPMLPILHGLQEEFGCVSAAAVPLIADPRRGAWRRDLLSRFSW